MALFRAQTAYMRAATRDVAFGTNVRALLGTAGADTNFTVTFTSTTAITQTVNPFTNISNVSADNRTTLGWAWNQNEASTDGIGSTSTRRRYIPAGVWSFQFAWTSNAAALLTSYDVILSYHVYRVAANGGTRTLLFSATAATVNVSSLGAGSDNGSASSTSQPAYDLAPDETIHVAIQINSKATSAALGGTTNTVITCTRGTSGTAFVTIPSPGMRDINVDTNTSIGSGVGLRSNYVRKDTTSAVGEGAGLVSKFAEYFRQFGGIGEGAATRNLLVVIKNLGAVGVGTGTRSIIVRKDVETATGAGIGTRSLLVRKDTLTAIGEGVGTYSKFVEFYRAFNSIGTGSGTRYLYVRKDVEYATGGGIGVYSRSLQLYRTFQTLGAGVGSKSILVKKDTVLSVGEGVSTIERVVEFVRAFDSAGSGVGDIAKAVIFVRSFDAVGKATIRPRITLDWDDLPDAGGGSVITNVYRPMFVFDD